MNKSIFIGLILLFIILAFTFQDNRGIWQPDEGYYVGTAITMDRQDDYLVPRICDEIFLDKPPLLYWGILSGHKLFGHNEFALRFSTGLSYFLTCILVFIFGCRVGQGFRDGFWSAIIYSTMALTFSAANFITMDTTLTFFTTLSMLAFWESIRANAKHPIIWKMILCSAVGLGFLTKGPAALVPTGAMFTYLLINKKVFSYFKTPWALLGLILFVITGLSWYIYISIKLPDAAQYLFDNQFVGRLISNKYQRNPGILGALMYLPIILFGTLPWSIDWFSSKKGILSYLKVSSWKTVLKKPEQLLLACWIIVPMAILCLASSRLGLYALPVFPALALVTASLRPEIRNASLPLINKRTIAFLMVWTVALLSSRFALAKLPTVNDCNSLWNELQPYLPADEYEIVAIDQRVDGLVFYCNMDVETITRKLKPYPTYAKPETVEIEIKDMAKDNIPHLFILETPKHLSEIKQMLLATNWHIQEIPLKHERILLLCAQKKRFHHEGKKGTTATSVSLEKVFKEKY